CAAQDDEGKKREVKTPEKLELKVPETLPIDFKEHFEKRLDHFLTGTAEERTTAEEALLRAKPGSAIAIHLRWKEEKDKASRQRLERLRDQCLVDSPETANLMLRHAGALHTVASNSTGPLKFDDDKLPELRIKAKLFFYFFVDAEPYADQVTDKDFGKVDHL